MGRVCGLQPNYDKQFNQGAGVTEMSNLYDKKLHNTVVNKYWICFFIFLVNQQLYVFHRN